MSQFSQLTSSAYTKTIIQHYPHISFTPPATLIVFKHTITELKLGTPDPLQA